MKMLWHIYLRKGHVFIPTVAKTDAGFFMDINPVAVYEASNVKEIVDAITAAIAKGNPTIPTPSRSTFPSPAILEYAKVKSWAEFEKSALCWQINKKDSIYQIQLMKKNDQGGWNDNPAKTENFSLQSKPEDIAQRAVELIKEAFV